jgi:hypothetical protein
MEEVTGQMASTATHSAMNGSTALCWARFVILYAFGTTP